jgi:hypothetical protein
VIFDIQYKDQKVVDGYSIADEVLRSDEIIERIQDLVELTYTKHSPIDVSMGLQYHRKNILLNLAPKIAVKSYYYRSPSVIATTYPSVPRTIFVNSRNIPSFPLQTYIENAAHEFGHVPMGYGHGSNWTQDTWKGRMMCRLSGDKEDKSKSVPRVLEKIVIDIAKQKGLI